MDEAELTQQALMLLEILLEGVALFFTVISAYIVALFYFLGRSPFLLKLISFTFFTMTIIFLAALAYGGQVHSSDVTLALEALDREGQLSEVGQGVLLRATAQANLDGFIQSTMWFFLATLYLALFYLTFFYRWPDSGTPKET